MACELMAPLICPDNVGPQYLWRRQILAEQALVRVKQMEMENSSKWEVGERTSKTKKANREIDDEVEGERIKKRKAN